MQRKHYQKRIHFRSTPELPIHTFKKPPILLISIKEGFQIFHKKTRNYCPYFKFTTSFLIRINSSSRSKRVKGRSTHGRITNFRDNTREFLVQVRFSINKVGILRHSPPSHRPIHGCQQSFTVMPLSGG